MENIFEGFGVSQALSSISKGWSEAFGKPHAREPKYQGYRGEFSSRTLVPKATTFPGFLPSGAKRKNDEQAISENEGKTVKR